MSGMFGTRSTFTHAQPRSVHAQPCGIHNTFTHAHPRSAIRDPQHIHPRTPTLRHSGPAARSHTHMGNRAYFISFLFFIFLVYFSCKTLDPHPRTNPFLISNVGSVQFRSVARDTESIYLTPYEPYNTIRTIWEMIQVRVEKWRDWYSFVNLKGSTQVAR